MLKQILISSLIAIAVSILIVIGFYNLIPLSVINPIATDNGMFGTSITTISGSDTVQNALKVIANDNFTALNAGKIENATTSLPLITDLTGLDTIGTITTGVWNATALTVAYGGTGSTTLSLNQVLLGNGTGILKTVAGFGTSGQFLTSNGAGSAPTWQSSTVNQTADYTWTGQHDFNATTTFNAENTFTASTTFSTATTTFSGGLVGIYDYQVFTASSTWTKPSKITGTEMVRVQVWGSGGGGGSCLTAANSCWAGGGGGGAYVEGYFKLSDLSATVAVEVNTGGAISTAGGKAAFGSYVIAYGGGGSDTGTGGQTTWGGGGGGLTSAGAQGTNGAGGTGGTPTDSFGGGAHDAAGIFGGGGGGNGGAGADKAGGNSMLGGGAGGGNGAAGGTATRYGGNGGAGCNTASCTATAGTAPGGGGGGSSPNAESSSSTGAAGARGEVRVWVIR